MSLPVVDFSHFQSSDVSIRQTLAEQIVKAFEDVGFMYLVGHGLDDKIIDAVFAQVRARRLLRNCLRGLITSPIL